jgi:hypothetical protein
MSATPPADRLLNGFCPDPAHERLEPSMNPVSERDAGWCDACQAWWAPEVAESVQSVDLTLAGPAGGFALWRVGLQELTNSEGGVQSVLARYREQTAQGWGDQFS